MSEITQPNPQSTPPAPQPRVGVGVLVKDGDTKALAGLRKGSHGAGTWGAPGGHIEYGESFKQCAIREVAEETGLEIENIQFLVATNDCFRKERKHYVTVWVTADRKDPNAAPEIKEPEKCEKWDWIRVPDSSWTNELYHEGKPLFLPFESLSKCLHPHTGEIEKDKVVTNISPEPDVHIGKQLLK